MGVVQQLLAAAQQHIDLLHRIADGRNGHIMIDGCNEVSSVLGAVNIKVPAALQQFGLPVGQISTQHCSQDAFLHSLVELGQTAGEQGECGIANDVLCAALLQLTGNFQHGFAGCDDIISNEYSLAFHTLTQILMRNDGVTAIDHTGVVTALVEHTQVAAQNAGIVHIAGHGAFVASGKASCAMVKSG